MIPETHVRVDRPREIPPPSVPSPFGPLDLSLAEASLEFYNATMYVVNPDPYKTGIVPNHLHSSLYMIMGRVLDIMYGSNLGCDKSQDVFSLASQVLQIEHQLSEAQLSFPPSLRLIEAANLTHETGSPTGPLLKFRIIYTLRYHNLRILTHRPLLHRYLEILSSPAEDAQQISALSQVGMNSLRICIQSAASIVELVSYLTSSGKDERVLMGAWWFSLYYS